MRLSIFADSKFITDGKGNFYSSSNVRRAMLYPLAERFEIVNFVCRLQQIDLSGIPKEDLINNPKINFFGVPYFKGPLGQFFFRKHILIQAEKAVSQSDVCLMRFASTISCVSMAVVKKYRKPSIGNALGEFGMEPEKNPSHIPVAFLRKPVARWIEKTNARHFSICDVLCGVTKSIAQKYAPAGRNVYQLVDSCLASEYYSPPHQPKKNVFTAIFAGRINEFKNIQSFLRAVALLKKENIMVRVVIAGQGGFLPDLKQLTDSLQLNGQVEFLGRIDSRKELWDWYRACDAGFLLSFSEGLPLGAIEPMSAGLPIIAADLDYIKPVITDGVEGFLVNPADIDMIKEKLKILATREDIYTKMARNAYEKSKDFSADRQAQVLYDLAKMVCIRS